MKPFIAFAILTAPLLVNADIKTDLSNSINNHFKVKSQEINLESSEIRLLDIDSADSFKVDLSTIGGTRLFDNIKKNSSNNTDNGVDLQLQVSKKIFDFGLADYSRQAEKHNSEITKIGVEQERENALHSIYVNAINYKSTSQKIQNIKQSIKHMDSLLSEQKERLMAGVGNTIEMADIAMEKVSLQGLLMSELSKSKNSLTILKNQFGIAKDQVSEIVEYATNVSNQAVESNEAISCLNKDSDRNHLKLDRTKSALTNLAQSGKYNSLAIQAKNNPNLFLNVKMTAYDVNRSFDEFGVSANIDFKFNIFDGGSSDVELKKENFSLKKRQFEMENKIEETKSKFSSLLIQCYTLQKELNVLKTKADNLKSQVDALNMKRKVVAVSSTELAKTIVSANQSQMSFKDIENQLLAININYLKLSEELLSRSGL